MHYGAITRGLTLEPSDYEKEMRTKRAVLKKINVWNFSIWQKKNPHNFKKLSYLPKGYARRNSYPDPEKSNYWKLMAKTNS